MEVYSSKRKVSDVPFAKLTDDLVVEILSRLPPKSLLCCRCVCKSWRDIISDPYHRKKLPQTLAGFFHISWVVDGSASWTWRQNFTNVSGRGPPLVAPDLGFIPSHAGDIVALDSCNGLLLCRNGGWILSPCGRILNRPERYDYIVCNPATERSVTFPDSGRTGAFRTSHLAFDPAVSSHFHIFEYEYQFLDGDEDDDGENHIAPVTEVWFYSSRNGEWTHSVTEFSQETDLYFYAESFSRSVFLNGALHFICSESTIGALDMETKKWRYIQLPPGGDFVFLGQSQGCLFYMNKEVDNKYKLSFWLLEDYASGAWNLKHTVSTTQLSGSKDFTMNSYPVIAVHPECNIVFFLSFWKNLLMAYNMDQSDAHCISVLGPKCHRQFMHYIPLFSKSLAGEGLSVACKERVTHS